MSSTAVAERKLPRQVAVDCQLVLRIVGALALCLAALALALQVPAPIDVPMLPMCR